MPPENDSEHETDSASKATYECLRCGSIVKSERHPSTCDCGGDFQNRANSLE